MANPLLLCCASSPLSLEKKRRVRERVIVGAYQMSECCKDKEICDGGAEACDKHEKRMYLQVHYTCTCACTHANTNPHTTLREGLPGALETSLSSHPICLAFLCIASSTSSLQEKDEVRRGTPENGCGNWSQCCCVPRVPMSPFQLVSVERRCLEEWNSGAAGYKNRVSHKRSVLGQQK